MDATRARSEDNPSLASADKPINVNFFCHVEAKADADREQAWRDRLSPYYCELGIDPDLPQPRVDVAPFDDVMCRIVEGSKPEVVSFHFGLPDPALVGRVKAADCRVMASATTVAEALWLEARGADIIVAQGYEAGGHRGMFLGPNLNRASASQPGTLALVPQVVDAVGVPVVAAGGIADGRGIAAAFALGAAGTQMGTAISSVLKQQHPRCIAMPCGMHTRTRLSLQTCSPGDQRAF